MLQKNQAGIQNGIDTGLISIFNTVYSWVIML